MIMVKHAEQYVGLKRRVGFRYWSQGWVVRAYAQYAADHGDQFMLSTRMIEWAAKTTSIQFTREKLRQLRDFAQWLRAEDERHEVPPQHAFGLAQRVRPTPHLLTPSEIKQLIELAVCRTLRAPFS